MSQTLKFGKGTWATKKGSTLAYNDEDGNFKPLPFTYTGAGKGTKVNKEGLIEVVENDRPRIDYTDSEDGVFLLEKAATNLVLKSDDILSTYQSQDGDVSDADTPINGFNNSIQIEYYTSSNSLVYKRDFNPTTGTEYTISCFVQMDDNSKPIHTVETSMGDFCLINNNTVVNASDIKTERIGSTNVYKVSATKTASDTNNRFGIIKYSTQSLKGFKATGFQLEQGSYATSYIPTQGTIQTRVQETASGSGNSEVFNSEQGVLFANIAANADDLTYRSISIGSGGGVINLFYSNVSNTIVASSSGGALIIKQLSDITNFNKIVFKYKQNDFSLWANGFEIGTDISGTTGDALTTLSFDNNVGGSRWYGKTKEIAYYDEILTDLELETLTSYRTWEEMVNELNLNVIYNG